MSLKHKTIAVCKDCCGEESFDGIDPLGNIKAAGWSLDDKDGDLCPTCVNDRRCERCGALCRSGFTLSATDEDLCAYCAENPATRKGSLS